MIIFRYLILLLLLVMISCGDDDDNMEEEMMEEEMMEEEMMVCGMDLYREDLFTNITITRDVVYGQNLDFYGDPITLMMDVFVPSDSPFSDRPTIIFAFGGSFIGGRRQDLEGFALAYAAKGYVTATIDYRILNIVKGLEGLSADEAFTSIVIKASSDMKAAIRHLKQSVTLDNPYGIDNNRIFASGVSAGAITAIIASYVDEEDDIPADILSLINANGGFSGDSGDEANLSFSSDVAGVLNFSGGINDINYIDSNDPPIFSYHGDMDETVPYDFGQVSVSGLSVGELYGSKAIHDKCVSLGIPSRLITVEGGGHTDVYIDPAYTTDRDESTMVSTELVSSIICQ